MGTREDWLNKAAVLLKKEFFDGHGYKLPKELKVSCGFARGGGDVIGQCFCPTVAADGKTVHMFICPTQGDALRVLDILLHEMIHACLGVGKKHGKEFKSMATEFGLVGKMTATVVQEGSALQKKLMTISGKLGDYPHSAIKLKKKLRGTGKNRKSVTLISRGDRKYCVGMHLTHLIEKGRPKDWNGVPMVAKKPEIEEMLRDAGVK